MSDLLTKPSTTKDGQKITQSGNIMLPDFKFSVDVDVNVHIDPEIKALLTDLIGVVTAQKQAVNVQPEATEKAEVAPEDLPIDEPLELTPNIPEELVEPEKYGHIVYGDNWNTVKNNKRLFWKEDAEGLHIKYWSGTVDTSWKEIERLAKLNKKTSNAEINKWHESNNCKTAVRSFIKCLKDGIVTKPVDPDAELESRFSKFQAEEDPDAIYKPVVTPFFSTRPDENSGKVEGTLEV